MCTASSVHEIYTKIKSGVYKITERIKARSPIWTLFGEVQKDDGTLIPDTVFCRMCQKLMKYNGRTTSNLVRHRCNILRNAANDCIKKLGPAAGGANGQELIVGEARKQLDMKAKQSLVEACSEWESEDQRAISSLDTDNFRKMVQTFMKLGAIYGEDLDINDVIPDSKTISQQIFTITEAESLDIKADLEDSVIEDTEFCEQINDIGSESDECSLAFSDPLVTRFSAQKRPLESTKNNPSKQKKIKQEETNTVDEFNDAAISKAVNVEPQPSCGKPMYDMVRANVKDDCAVYCDHVACKIRHYSTRTKNIVQHHINNILFDADMGKYEPNDSQPTTSATE